MSEAVLDAQEALSSLDRGVWFAELPNELRRQIVEAATVATHDRGEVVIQQGSMSTGLFAVLEGLVELGRWLDEDDYVLVHVCQPAFWFGEIPTLCGLPAPVETRARTDVRLLHLSPERVERFFEEDPRTFRLFARLAFERYALFVRLTARLQHRSPELQLRQRLMEIAALHNLESSGGNGLELAVSQSDLAEIVGLSRQTVNRLLKSLEADGLIERSFKRIRLLDPDRWADRSAQPDRLVDHSSHRGGPAELRVRDRNP